MGKKKHAEHVNHERWLVSYADFITLLFAFFVVMFAVSQVDSKKVGRFQDSFSLAIGLSTDEKGYLPRAENERPPISASMLPLRELPVPGETDGGESGAVNRPPRFPAELAELQQILEEKKALEAALAGVKVIRRGNDLVLRLDATAIFDSGDDRVRPESLEVLKAIADQVRERQVQIRVEGHTDDQPIKTLRFRSNWDLSTARATSVVSFLASMGRIDPRRIAAVGYAEFQPIGSNDTSEGRQQNRRVDFVLSVSVPTPPPTEPRPVPGAEPASESKAEPAKAEPAKPEPEPAKPEPAQPAKAEPPKAEPKFRETVIGETPTATITH
ncbi:MAG: OmpA family protein [Deltaproteobacteria bacterium]|jgi:chemotaxis protein MotB|nr:OmpA family protein [Deltaproteobacteria bacterium]